MSTDPQPAKLYPALLAAMREFNPVVKNKQNPHLKNFYADLSAVLEAVTEPLANHGLLITQRFDHEQGQPILVTEIIHAESGQALTSTLPIVSKDPSDPQKLGGAITYARRYSLVALLSLTAEDDDGNAASKPAPPRQQERPAPASTGTPAPAANGKVKYSDPRHAAPYSPRQAVREELAAREATPLTEKEFDQCIESAWELMENGSTFDAIKTFLNEHRPRMNEEQRIVARQQVTALETAVYERDAVTTPAAAPAAPPSH